MVKKRSPTIKKLFSNKVSLLGSPTLVMKFWGNKNTNCPIQSNAQCHRHCRAEPTYIFWDSLVSSFSSSNGDSDNDLNQAPCPLFRAMPERKHFFWRCSLRWRFRQKRSAISNILNWQTDQEDLGGETEQEDFSRRVIGRTDSKHQSRSPRCYSHLRWCFAFVLGEFHIICSNACNSCLTYKP